MIFLGDLLRLPDHELMSALGRPERIWQLQEELSAVELALGDALRGGIVPSP